MSFDAPQNEMTAADQAMPTGERRSFLTDLDEAVREHGGMSCGVVPRSGTPVLHVINAVVPRRSTEAGADYADGAWWFTWASTGDTVRPVDDPAGVTGVVARVLGAHMRVRP